MPSLLEPQAVALAAALGLFEAEDVRRARRYMSATPGKPSDVLGDPGPLARQEAAKFLPHGRLQLAVARGELRELENKLGPKRELFIELLDALSEVPQSDLPDSAELLMQRDYWEVCRKRRLIEDLEQRIQRAEATIAGNEVLQTSERRAAADSRVQAEKRWLNWAIRVCALVGRIGTCRDHLRARATAPAVTATSALTSRDVRLAEEWAGEGTTSGAQLRKMYSARAAELIAQIYYRALDLDPQDVAIEQIEGGVGDAWLDYDIRLHNRCVDVKNARESFSSPGRYVEHCVPRFKHDRATRKGVVIAGVLSKYIAQSQPYLEEPQVALFLGEVSLEQMTAANTWMEMRFGDRLDLGGAWREGHVAGWQFEFPIEHYPRRRVAKVGAFELVKELHESEVKVDQIPGWLWVLAGPRALPTAQTSGLSPARQLVLQDLWAIDEGPGLSRRSLYLYALGITAEALREGHTAAGCLSDFRWAALSRPEDQDATYADSGWTRNAAFDNQVARRVDEFMGLEDPLGHVGSLVNCLADVSEAILRMGLKIRRFRLTHPQILRGEDELGRTRTLLAYCGGWRRYPFVARCGSNPLTLRANAACDVCGYLTCRDCGHCSLSCPSCGPRQHLVAAEDERRVKGRALPTDFEDYADDDS